MHYIVYVLCTKNALYKNVKNQTGKPKKELTIVKGMIKGRIRKKAMFLKKARILAKIIKTRRKRKKTRSVLLSWQRAQCQITELR